MDRHALVVAALLLAFSAEASAQRLDRLTGDWGGARSRMEAAGLALDLELTMFEQGLVSGSGPEEFDFGYRLDGFVRLDSAKMGLWKGGGFVTHLEYRSGDLPGNLGGTFWATNSGMAFPSDAPDKLVATSLYYTQRLSDRAKLAIGKINPFDLLDDEYFYGGWGNHRFMNLVYVAPPSGLIPPVFMGGIGSYRTDWGDVHLWIYDPKDRTNDYAPGDLFDSGVTVSLTPVWRMEIDGRPSSFALGGIYTTKSGVDFTSISGDYRPGQSLSAKQGSYSAGFHFSHLLHVDRADPRGGWGAQVKVAFSDGNPNYIRRSLSMGIGGKGLFRGREQDGFGLGYFYYDLSDALQDALATAAGRPGDEQGFEAFYSYAATPWLHLSADLQYIDPAGAGLKNAFVAGIRANVRF